MGSPRLDEIMEECPTCIVVLTGRKHLEQEVEEAGGMLYVLKPLIGNQVRRVVESARLRFQHFQEVRAQATTPEEAKATWQAVQHALNLLVGREAISEEDGFAHLVQRAKAEGSSLGLAAEHLVAELT